MKLPFLIFSVFLLVAPCCYGDYSDYKAKRAIEEYEKHLKELKEKEEKDNERRYNQEHPSSNNSSGDPTGGLLCIGIMIGIPIYLFWKESYKKDGTKKSENYKRAKEKYDQAMKRSGKK